MTKINEKALRVKYLRTLEKFANSAILALKREDFDAVKFQERMQKNQKFFQKCEVVVLNSPYSKALENFVNACLDLSKQKKELLNLANALDKLKKAQKNIKLIKDYL